MRKRFDKPTDSKRRERPNGRRLAPRRQEEPGQSRTVHGLVPVRELLKSGSRRVERILIADGSTDSRFADIQDLAKEANVFFQKVPREVVDRLASPGAVHQGIVAVVAAADYADFDSVMDGLDMEANPMVLLLDGVEDPRNLGAILRVAECAGVVAVFVPEHRASGITETVVKTSAGATEYLPVIKVKNLNNLIRDIKELGFWVVGAAGAGAELYTEWDWRRPTALVMGNEGQGLHRLVAENCDGLIRIPMAGKIESLNVSVATGVILFEATRQKSAAG